MVSDEFYYGLVLRILAGIMIVLLLLAGGGSAATPINSCTNISSPGNYVLNQNIINSSASTCIAIISSDVVFDGAGYTIDGVDAESTFGVYVHNSTTSITNATVKNLKLTDWYNGIYYNDARNGSITNNTVNSNINYAIMLLYSDSNSLTNNTASNNYGGIVLANSGSNTIYNNYFNNTLYFASSGFYTNYWNITKTSGTNIVGGPYLGGNFWAKPDGTGFSQTCADADSDFICDSNFTLDALANNIDYLPLVYKPSVNDTIPPAITFTFPTNGQEFTTSTITVSGTASDNVGLGKVEVKIGNESCQLASGTNTWSATVTLATGSNTIYAKATDTSGNTNETSVTATLNPPGISSCTTISSPGTYTLNQSIGGASTCITITSSDVIFDGAGYTISGIYSSSSFNYYPVYVHNSTIALTNITVKNLIVNGICDYCIYYNNVQNGSMTNNIVSGRQNMFHSETLYGIYLVSSNNNTLIGNNANSNVGHYVTMVAKYDWGNGIVLSSSNNNTLIGNNANSNGLYGIYLTSSNDNTLIGNNADSNLGYSYIMTTGTSYYGKGLLLESSTNNLLISNIANSNGQYDIYLSSSSINRIYNNYFNNTNNYGISNSTNNWNIIKTPGTNIVGGSYLGGNFWAKPDGTGFSQTCADADSDFICDSPYILDSSNIDSLPLVYKTSTSPDTTLPVITITSPINGQRFTTSTITISGTTSDNSGLIKVEVKAGTGSWQLASGTNTWSATVTLATGSNTIYAKTTDTYGNINETSVTVSYNNPLPIAEYHFDGNASDSSGNGNHGTINGATFVQGISGQALSFDGVDDYVRVNNISVGQSITVLAWAKSATPTWNQYGWIASARDANGFIIHPNIGEKYWDGFVINSDGNYSQIGIYTPGNITQWHQYRIIYDYDAQKGYMVFDGQIVANKSISMTRIAGNINVEFGKDYGFDDRYGNGTIDEISIYSIALNTSEILANYNTLADSLGGLRGDVNRNGIRDTGDATIIMRYIVDLSIPSEYLPILPTGDMNCNGIIDTGDATLVLRDIVGLDIPRCWE